MAVTATERRTTAQEALAATGPAGGLRLPRLLPGLEPVGLATGLLVRGARNPQVFGGRSATSLLPRVLAALDGTRTTAELAAALSLPEPAVAAVVALLDARGLVEDGGRRPAPDGPVGRWLAHAARAAGEGLRPPAGLVLLGGDGPAVERLAVLLDANEVATDTGSPLDGDLLVAVVREPEPTDVFRRVDAEARRSGSRWLRVVLGPAGGQVGPLFATGEQPTYERWLPTRVVPPAAPPVPLADELTLAHAATEVTHLVTGTGQPVTLTGWADLDAATGAVTARPRVPAALPVTGSGRSLAAAFDLTARHDTGRGGTGPDDARQRMQAFDLGAVQQVEDAGGAGWLTGVLRAAFGPAGSFGAQPGLAGYLLVAPGATGWPAGEWRHHAAGDGLIDLAGTSDAAGWLAAVAPAAVAVVVVTATLPAAAGPGPQLAALRTAHLDAGRALHRLGAGLGARGLRLRPLTGSPYGEVADLLGLLTRQEPVLAAVRVEREGPA